MDSSDEKLLDLKEHDISRYARHLSLPEIGVLGQRKLKSSSVLCIGAGGLGSPLLIYLAAAGVGRIGIIDYDFVEESNLQRQIIHSIESLGNPKINSAKNRILQINPYCKVDQYNIALSKDNALEILDKYQIICDCTDNFPSRYLINDACIILGKPNVFGSIQGFQGQATVFNMNSQSPNYRDLIPEPPPKDLLPSCAEGGVLGVLPGIIGLIQATETIKIITDIGDILDGRLLVFDALSMRFKELNLIHDSKAEKIKELIDYEEFCSTNELDKNKTDSIKLNSISIANLKGLILDKQEKIILIDVRNSDEHEKFSIPGSVSIPLNYIEDASAINKIKALCAGKQIYCYCKTGTRSDLAVKVLNKHNIKSKSIQGGIESWRRNI